MFWNDALWRLNQGSLEAQRFQYGNVLSIASLGAIEGFFLYEDEENHFWYKSASGLYGRISDLFGDWTGSAIMQSKTEAEYLLAKGSVSIVNIRSQYIVEPFGFTGEAVPGNNESVRFNPLNRFGTVEYSLDQANWTKLPNSDEWTSIAYLADSGIVYTKSSLYNVPEQTTYKSIVFGTWVVNSISESAFIAASNAPGSVLLGSKF